MKQGHKISRFVAWTFFDAKEQHIWYENKENND
jgi:23S rRNA A1618 N6-methylase RlmF